MNRQQMLDIQRGFAEIHQFELIEQRQATPETRMRQIDAIWSIAHELGISCDQQPFDPFVRDQWTKLRKAIHERDRASSQ